MMERFIFFFPVDDGFSGALRAVIYILLLARDLDRTALVMPFTLGSAHNYSSNLSTCALDLLVDLRHWSQVLPHLMPMSFLVVSEEQETSETPPWLSVLEETDYCVNEGIPCPDFFTCPPGFSERYAWCSAQVGVVPLNDRMSFLEASKHIHRWASSTTVGSGEGDAALRKFMKPWATQESWGRLTNRTLCLCSGEYFRVRKSSHTGQGNYQRFHTMRQHLRFHPAIEATAQDWRHRAIGSARYLAVYIRRSDYEWKFEDLGFSFSAILAYTRLIFSKLLRQGKGQWGAGSRVMIATEDWTPALEHIVNISNLPVIHQSAENFRLSPDVPVLVPRSIVSYATDLLACAHADFFLGTNVGSNSDFIVDLGRGRNSTTFGHLIVEHEPTQLGASATVHDHAAVLSAELAKLHFESLGPFSHTERKDAVDFFKQAWPVETRETQAVRAAASAQLREERQKRADERLRRAKERERRKKARQASNQTHGDGAEAEAQVPLVVKNKPQWQSLRLGRSRMSKSNRGVKSSSGGGNGT
uniref:Uncharacterized protein n=1 Tax=Rhizochromulina marina TaxID=1034831 RepID=A0A7S2WW22_9STRA|mmetsp:Transcript_9479/g.26823  ORF Transcript_9479/g.26823 Transcript_9479/m.26823 type:complete len:530 (+) Transcript_9479:381-1970(+)